MMRLCFDCLLAEKPDWPRRYALTWGPILGFGAAAFAVPYWTIGVILQAAFFALVFAWAIYPLRAARRP